jgi:hypothetical protein
VTELDNELTSQKPDVKAYLKKKKKMKRNSCGVEPSAPYTGAKNDGAERSGGVSKGDILEENSQMSFCS